MSSKLFQAIGKKSSCSEVESILLKHPEAAKQKDNYGMLPLHHALYYKASPNIIKILFEAYPEAVKEKDWFYGMLPLHVALRHEASPDIITMLFAAYPEASEVENTDGNLPLHIAVKYNASPDKIKMLVYAFPESITIKNQDGQLPIDLCKADESEIQHSFTILKLEQYQQLQHEQLSYCPPLEYCDEIKFAPSSSDGKNKKYDSKSLLTKAFMNNTGDKTGSPKKLQEHQIHSTTSITSPNNKTYTALVTSPNNTTLNTLLEHTDNMSDVTSDVIKNSHAVSSCESSPILQHLQINKESLSVFPFVCALSEDAIVLSDHNMNQKNVSMYETPHILKPSKPNRKNPSENCDNVSMQNQKTNTGDMESSVSDSSCTQPHRSSVEGLNLLEHAETPLDYLHDKSYGSAELLILCKRAYENKTKETHGKIKDWFWNHEMNHQFLKDALHQRDDDHRTPIHFLAGAKAPFLLFKLIIDLAPDSVMKLDKTDRLPLHWAARYCASTEVVNFLIDKFPESVFEFDSHGMSPLHHVPDNSHLRHLLRGPDLPDPYENKNQDDKKIIFVVNRTGRRLKVEYRKALRSAQLVGGGVVAPGLGGINFNVIPRPDSKISTVVTIEPKETCKLSANKCKGLKFDFWCQSKEGFGWKTNVFVPKGYTQEVRGQPYKLK